MCQASKKNWILLITLIPVIILAGCQIDTKNTEKIKLVIANVDTGENHLNLTIRNQSGSVVYNKNHSLSPEQSYIYNISLEEGDYFFHMPTKNNSLNKTIDIRQECTYPTLGINIRDDSGINIVDVECRN